jgi:hypothetical protein
VKAFFLILFLSLTALTGYAQGFDDMAYSNPDMPTYFQQEMTSLMRFQAKYNINVPFFVSYSGRSFLLEEDSYISSLRAQFHITDENRTPFSNENFEQRVLAGFQFKLSPSFYLPVFFLWGISNSGTFYVRDITYKGGTLKEPLLAEAGSDMTFVGSGLFINTDKVKGGVYMGWSFRSGSRFSVESPSLNYFLEDNGSPNFHTYHETENPNLADNDFKIALAPLVNTSEWKYVGKVLENILGYFGLGDALMNSTETDEDSKFAAAASAINAALDFSFNRIHWDNFSLDIQAMYMRGNFDGGVKADTYGAKITGLFSNFPFGFTFAGGYKHFSLVSPYFSQGYGDGTGYFDGSIYFPFKRITLGVMYQYDNIYKSKFGVALSSNTFSGIGLLNTTLYYDWGFRFRWGGWNAGK